MFKITKLDDTQIDMDVKVTSAATYIWTLKVDYKKVKKELVGNELTAGNRWITSKDREKGYIMVKDYEKPYVLTKFSKDFYDNPNKYESSLRKINDCLAKRYKDLSFDKIKEFVNKENLDIEIKKSLELREKAQANRHELNSRQKDIINNIVKICEIKDELNFYACLMGWSRASGTRTEGQYFLSTKDIAFNQTRVETWDDNYFKTIVTHELAHYTAFQKGTNAHSDIWLKDEYDINRKVFNEEFAQQVLKADIYKYGVMMPDADINKIEALANEKGWTLIQNESNAKFTLLNKDNTTINYLSLNKNEENKIINIFEQQITNIGNSLGNVIKTTDENDKKIEVISLGIKELDDASGIGGLPVGRIIEMFSKEIEISQDVILKTIISAQKNDKRVAYIDMDNSLDLQKAKQAGLESKNLLLAQPTCGEQVFDLIESLTKTNMIDLIVVNNVGAMNSKFNTADERLDVITNQTARMMSKGLRAIQPLVAENKTALVFLNEPAQKENMFFDQEHLYGGRALRFYSTQRIELRKLKNEVQAKFVKNKLATPLTKAIFALNEDKNLDHDYSNTAIDVVENKENNTLELVDKNNKRTETNTNEQLIEEEKQNVVEQGYIVGKITKIADETLIIENNYIGYEIPKNNIKSQENPYKSRNSSLNDLGKAMRSLGYNQIEIDAVQKIDFDNTHELSDMISISIKAIAKYGSFNEEFNERKWREALEEQRVKKVPELRSYEIGKVVRLNLKDVADVKQAYLIGKTIEQHEDIIVIENNYIGRHVKRCDIILPKDTTAGDFFEIGKIRKFNFTEKRKELKKGLML